MASCPKRTGTHAIGRKDETQIICNRAPRLVGDSPAIQKLKQVVNRIAPTDMTVLITGESGTGKEEVAREIHSRSKRALTLFTAINCAAFPAELIESELFGHEKGAFTGASFRRIGKLEAADGSTLLLDEIGEMPLSLQAKLLRFLQEREIQRIGSNHTIKLNVRVIAATNRVLPGEIKAGRFRADLYYRLQTCQITVPPLRERRGDIRQLVAHFTSVIANRQEDMPSFTDEALQTLEQHEWLGNVRELASAVEYAVRMCCGAVVTIDDLPENVRCSGRSAGEGKGDGELQPNQRPSATRLRIPALACHQQWRSSVNQIRAERSAIARRIVDECGGNKTLAAKEMGISRTRLYEVLKEGGN